LLRRRFIAAGTIARARAAMTRGGIESVALDLRDGTTLDLITRDGPFLGAGSAALAARIQAFVECTARSPRPSSEAPPPRAALVAEPYPEDIAAAAQRGGRSVREWLASLRAIGLGAASGFRTAPVDPAHLWSLLAHPAANASDRAAAAIALDASPDP